MFKYKLITLILLIITSCNTPDKDVLHEEDSYVVGNHDHVLSRTDSILVLADGGIEVMKKEKLEQRTFLDSLQHTIEIEQYIIYDLNKEVDRRNSVDVDLQLTMEELENALIKCEEKEKELSYVKERFALKSENFMDEKVYLINFYNNKIDSLVKKINILEKDTTIIDLLEENTNKKRNKKRNKKKSEN